MEDKNVSLTPAEWNVMECLWQQEPCTVMQMVAMLRERVGWAKSTTTTMITRMEAKGLICCDPAEKPRHYHPLVGREEAVRKETQTFVERIFQGSVGMMMSNIVENRRLTKEELEELYEILRKAEEETND